MKKVFLIILLALFGCSSAPLTISQAFSEGVEVKCSYNLDNHTSTIYLKGGLLRLDKFPDNTHAIYTAEEAYLWVDKQGTIVSSEKIAEMKTQKEIVLEAQANGAICENADISNNIFKAPSNVQFQELSELIGQKEVLK